MISSDQRDAAIQFLGADDLVIYQRLKAARARRKADRLWSRAFLDATGAVKERECIADVNEECCKAEDEADGAEAELQGLLAKREEARIICDQYQTDAADTRAALRP